MTQRCLLAALVVWLPCLAPAMGAETGDRSAAEYARDLESTDRAVRREAAYQLSRMGKAAKVAVPQLIRALDDDQQQVWFGAISTLANLGPDAEAALPALLEELKAWQPFRKDRQGAQALYRTALALGSIGAPAVPALSNLLASDKWFVRAGSARALGFAGSPAQPVVPALVRLLADDRAEVREAASETLALQGGASVPKVVEMLQGEEESRARLACALTLRRLGTNAVAALPVLGTVAEKDADAAVRVECLAALARCGMAREAWVDLLLRAARDPLPPVREGAFGLLLTVRPVETLLAPRLTPRLRSAEAADREWAARLVAELGVEARSLAGVLTEQLRLEVAAGRGPDAGLTRALAALGEAAVRPIFAELARDTTGPMDSADWRRMVLRQVSALAVPALGEGLTNAAPSVRAAALEGLAALGPSARSVARRLPSLLEDPDPAVRSAAWSAAAACGVPADKLMERVEPGLKDDSPAVRRAILGAVAKLGNAARSVVPVLVREMGSSDEALSREAIRALSALGPDAAAAVEPLATFLTRTTAVDRQIEVLAALSAVGSDAGGALDRMTPLLAAGRSEVRCAAAEAIGRLRSSGKAAFSRLEQATHDREARVRAAALSALASVDPDADAVGAAVMRGLDDSDASVRRAACAALVVLGEKGRLAEARLFALLGEKEDREGAKEALRAIHPTSVSALVELLRNSDWTLRELAADSLARLGKAAADAVPALERLVRDDPQEDVKRAARRATRRIREG